VAVIGSVAASLYSRRLAATIPAGLPHQAVVAAKSSVGGALVAAQHLHNAGAGLAARTLTVAAINAFRHSLSGACWVAGSVAVGGAVMAAVLLPSRPAVPTPVTEPDTEVEPEPELVSAVALAEG